MRYKLMLIDCDRTLLNDKGFVTKRAQNAIRDAIQKGIKVVFASGRAPSGIDNILKDIKVDGLFDYYICFNGGLIVRLKDKQVVSEITLNVDDVGRIVDSVYCKPEDYYVLTANRLICNGNNQHANIEAIKNSMSVTREDVRLLNNNEKIFKFVFAGGKEWLDKINQRLPEILRQQYNVTRSEPNNLEFVPLRASKGYALLTLTEMLNINIQETICFGDAENDASMLELAGTGVAMGNASEMLKNIADYVTDNNNNDGLAKAIEKLVLTSQL